VIQASYSSISPAIDDWYKTVNDSTAARTAIANAQQQITSLQSQIASLQTQILQDTSDEAQLLGIIRSFAQGQKITDLNHQLTSWLAANPGA